MLSAIILAAGEGKRLGAKVAKPLVKIGNKPAIIYSLSTLDKHPDIDEIILVLNAKNQAQITKIIKKLRFKKLSSFVIGGKRRQDSVYNGLIKISKKSNWVLIHDSARPFIRSQFITKVILAAKNTGAAILAVPVKATIKSVKVGLMVDKTVDRSNLWEIQTPQVFKKELIIKAYKKYSKNNVTDDATLVERLGKKIKVVQGSYDNIKITTEEDLLIAQAIANKNAI